MKVKVNHQLAIWFTAAGEVEFGKDFLEKVGKCIDSIGRDFNSTAVASELSTKEIIARFQGVPLNLASDLKTKVVQEVVLLAEHGPNSDILDQLINRNPKLRTHPKLASVIGAFENMNRVIQEVLGDQSNAMKAKLQQREGLELDPADLEATQRTARTLTPAERAEFRVQAILGQTAEQVEAARTVGKDSTSALPEVYKKVAGKAHPKVDMEAIGDEGNVFTRPSKK